jgi:hypothetical protein
MSVMCAIGVRNKHGMSGNSCLGSITQWIVATLGPGSSGQDHLARHQFQSPNRQECARRDHFSRT